ncbi:MAG: hypothetical protein R3B82_19230 [Sandaracinaceae bacterium]
MSTASRVTRVAALVLLFGLFAPAASHAQEAEAPSQPTLARLCTALRAEEGGERMSRCQTVREARRGRVRAAVLRVTVLEGNSPEQLVIAVHGRAGWRRVGTLGPPAYSGHGMLGSLELTELRVLEDDGHPVIRARARYWQGEPEGDCVRGPVEEHLTLCRDDGGWRCLELPVGSGAERAQEGPLSEGGATCEPRPGAAEWSVTAELAHGTVTVAETRGPIPEALRPRLVTRSFEDALE